MIFLAGLIAYLIGSIPSAYVIGKVFFGEDIRTKGSGNVGSTNALRNFGRKAGFAVLCSDVLKGTLAVFIGNKLAGYNGMALAELMVVLGHMYSIYLGFKSGKGVATTVGGLFYINFKLALLLAVIFITSVAITKIVSFSSLLIAAVMIVGGYFVFGLSYVYYVIVILGVLIFYKHRENIDRLRKGEESKISLR